MELVHMSNPIFKEMIPVIILDHDGKVDYYPQFFSQHESKELLDYLLKNVEWEHDRLKMFGKEIITKRQVAWCGDDYYEYKYSGQIKRASIWTPALVTIRDKISSVTKEEYNSCLLNLYRDGSEGMSWHSDDEKAMKESKSIASISLGAPRKFAFKHKLETIKKSLVLENGSLLDMKWPTQEFWLHALPETKKVDNVRVNLTFRKFEK